MCRPLWEAMAELGYFLKHTNYRFSRESPTRQIANSVPPNDAILGRKLIGANIITKIPSGPKGKCMMNYRYHIHYPGLVVSIY